MRKQVLLFVILIIVGAKCFSQIIFEPGYFINEENEKINCLIKNIDWKNNPTGFEYKLAGDLVVKQADIQNIKEFGITSVSKYIRALVNIDRSNASNHHSSISSERNPVFSKELLFLKVLIEGKASLYHYVDDDLIRYFYKVDDSEINQLVYKRYLIREYYVAENEYFKQQLVDELKCSGIKSDEAQRVEYNTRPLERFFTKYNECHNTVSVNFEQKQKKDLFNLTIRPGINISNLSVYRTVVTPMDNNFNTHFNTKINFRFGVESEIILPFNKNKWAVIIEPTYQYYKSEKTNERSTVSGGLLIANVDYKSIELPLGLRHAFFLKNKSNIFINASYIMDFSYKLLLTFTRSDGSDYIEPTNIKYENNWAIGLGYKHKDRYSLEIRYHTNRKVIRYYPWGSDYKTISIIFGYSLF